MSASPSTDPGCYAASTRSHRRVIVNKQATIRPHRCMLVMRCACGPVAHAQPSGPRAGTPEDLTITARKFVEILQDTPIAVTAFSGDALVERQIFRTDKLDQVVPNLQFADNAPLAGN